MIFSERMLQLVAVVLDRDGDAVTRELLRQGVLHMVQISQIAADVSERLAAEKPQVALARIEETRRRIEAISGSTPAVALDLEAMKTVDLDAADKELDLLAAAVQAVRERQRVIQQEISRLEEMGRQLELFKDLGEGLRAASTFSFLSFQVGSVPAERLDSFTTVLRALPSVQLTLGERDQRQNLLVISLRRDAGRMEPILREHGWEEATLSASAAELKGDALEQLGGRLAGLRTEQEGCAGEARALLDAERGRLEELWAQLRMFELTQKVRSYFSHTAHTVVFSGWVPAGTRGSLDRSIRAASGGHCALEWRAPLPGELAAVPVRLRNPRFLAPFQMLVQNFAIPAYGTIDPTPFVAIAYLCMFGLMFGDAGQGAVLVLVGLVGRRLARGAKQGVRSLLELIAWCGGASIVAGVLFGSYFGMAWLPAVWFDYHGLVAGHVAAGSLVTDIFGVLAITLYFGIGVIALGLVLNWVNLVSSGNWLELVLSKGGILGAWLYGAGVYAAFVFAGSGYRELPAMDTLALAFGIPMLVLAAGPPLRHRRHGGPVGFFTVVDWVMEWGVELLEIATGYLANTLSFMRVAGLGIAHASLMIAFFSIARTVSPGGASLWSVLVLIIGNVLVILLEGLSAGIQSLRLNYYEFFSKYFSGAGKAYLPVSLGERK